MLSFLFPLSSRSCCMLPGVHNLFHTVLVYNLFIMNPPTFVYTQSSEPSGWDAVIAVLASCNVEARMKLMLSS